MSRNRDSVEIECDCPTCGSTLDVVVEFDDGQVDEAWLSQTQTWPLTEKDKDRAYAEKEKRDDTRG